MNLFKKLFGTTNEKQIQKLQPLVDQINALEPSLKSLSDAQLREKTKEYQSRAQNGESLEALLPDPSKLVRVAMAVRQRTVSEIAKRSGAEFGVCSGDEHLLQLLRGCFPEERFEYCRLDNLPACVVVLENWRESFGDVARMRLEAHPCRIEFRYEIDDGSMIYLKERIGRIRDERQLQPGSLSF